jgi:hypothetical protein
MLQTTGLLHIINQHDQSSKLSPLLEMGSSESTSDFDSMDSDSSGTSATVVVVLVEAWAAILHWVVPLCIMFESTATSPTTANSPQGFPNKLQAHSKSVFNAAPKNPNAHKCSMREV